MVSDVVTSASAASSVGALGGGPKSDQVYRWLRAEVGEGRLRPKDRVNADQVSRDLAVSKVPVREAIARLAAEGALIVLPNAGAVVTPLSWRELADIQQARLILEPPAAALAAQLSSTARRARVAELRRTVSDMRRWAKSGDGDPFALNRRFHLQLISMAGNELLTAMLDTVLQRVSRYRVLAQHTPESARSTAAEHVEILRALTAGDSEQAHQLLAAHLRSSHNVAADSREVDPRYFDDAPDAS